MSAVDELNRIIQAKQNLREAIVEKGVAMPDNALIDSYASYVNKIPNGPESDVHFKAFENVLTPTNPHKMSGFNIWTDGNKIYYSGGNNLHYELTEETDTQLIWTKRTWTNLTNFSGNNVWTDGTNIYYSSTTTQYVLDVENETWNQMTWNGLTSFYGNAVWTDGTDIYYCSGAASTRYVLDKETHTWTSVSSKWTGLANMYGYYMFRANNTLYHAIIQLQGGAFSYITQLHKIASEDTFKQINPTSQYASPGAFNGSCLWDYKGKIRSSDLGPMIFDPNTDTIKPDIRYSPTTFIGVGYMFTTTPNKNIKLGLRCVTFGQDRDVDYSVSNVYALYNGQCYKLVHS